MSSSENKKDLYYVHSAITIALFVFTGFLPPFGDITPLGMKVLGVFLGMLYGWLTVGFAWPSLLGLFFLGVTGITDVGSALSAGWGSLYASVLVILGFVYAYYLESCKLTDVISAFFLTRKVLDGRPWVMVTLIILATWALGAFVNIYASIFLMWSIMYKIFDIIGYEKRSMRVAYLISVIPFASTIGMIYLPFHGGPIMNMGFVRQAIPDFSIPTLDFLIYQTITLVLIIIAVVICGKFLFRLDYSDMAKAENFAYLGGKKLTYEQKFGICNLILLVAILVAPDILPKGSSLNVFCKTLGITGAFALCIALAAIFKGKDGKSMLNISEATSHVAWDIIWLLVATMPIATAMQSADCGIMSTIVGAITGLAGDMHWMMFTVIISITMGLVTQVSHNLILAIVLFAPMVQVCTGLGGDPSIFFMAMFWTNQIAFATPAASATAAVVHGNSEWISSKQAYATGTLWMVLTFIIAVGLGTFVYGPMIF